MPNPSWYLNRGEQARIQRLTKPEPAPVPDVDGPCWVWQGATMPNGYGKVIVRSGEQPRAVHRVLWEAYNACEVPDGYQLDHLCYNRSCCNPEHLEPVTPSENTMRQRHANRKKMECPKGHVYDDANTILGADGKRRCRTCRQARGKIDTTDGEDPSPLTP